MSTKKVVLSILNPWGFIFTFLAAVALAVVPINRAAESQSMGHEIYSNYYSGEVSIEGVPYPVNIVEGLRTDGYLRIVQVDLAPSGARKVYSIGGHSSNAGNLTDWSQISICGPRYSGDQAAGCNFAERRGDRWDFVPCKADKGKVKPFTPAEIDEYTAMLNRALFAARAPVYMTAQWAWDPVMERVNKVYPLPGVEAGS